MEMRLYVTDFDRWAWSLAGWNPVVFNSNLVPVVKEPGDETEVQKHEKC
jgi:hypothetical protein